MAGGLYARRKVIAMVGRLLVEMDAMVGDADAGPKSHVFRQFYVKFSASKDKKRAIYILACLAIAIWIRVAPFKDG